MYVQRTAWKKILFRECKISAFNSTIINLKRKKKRAYQIWIKLRSTIVKCFPKANIDPLLWCKSFGLAADDRELRNTRCGCPLKNKSPIQHKFSHEIKFPGFNDTQNAQNARKIFDVLRPGYIWLSNSELYEVAMKISTISFNRCGGFKPHARQPSRTTITREYRIGTPRTFASLHFAVEPSGS